MGYRVAVVGATGNVGREMLNILAERQFPVDEVAAVASARSTGDVIDTQTRRVVATLTDEHGRAVQSEKMLEVDVTANGPVAAGDQFGIGRKRQDAPGPTAPQTPVTRGERP